MSRTKLFRRIVTLSVLTALLALTACTGGSGGPALGLIADQQTTLGEPIEVQPVIVSNVPDTVTLSASSSNEQVVADAGLVVSGAAANRTLTITPSSTVTGTATVTVTVQDARGQSSRQFAVTVAAPFEQPGEQLLPAEVGDLVGTSVAISDKYAVVGGFEFVYVFERVADEWVEMQKLGFTAQNGIAINFGGAVDVDGERIIVGADGDYEGGDHAGAAFIFELIGGSWVEVKKLTDTLPADFDSFGRSVAIHGDYAFVGAQNDSQNGIQSGSVFVFQDMEIGGWGLLSILTPADAQEDDVFAESVDADGGLLIVGNYGDPARGIEAGSANIFELQNFVWTEVIELAPVELDAGDQFGLSVAIGGNYALVGSYNDDDEGANAGAAYVFHDSGNGWQQVDKLYAPDPTDNDAFGASVDLSYPYAVITAAGDDDPATNAGSVFVFRHDGTTWHLVADLESPAPVASGGFGWDVATNGEFVIASAFNSPRLTAVFER